MKTWKEIDFKERYTLNNKLHSLTIIKADTLTEEPYIILSDGTKFYLEGVD